MSSGGGPVASDEWQKVASDKWQSARRGYVTSSLAGLGKCGADSKVLPPGRACPTGRAACTVVTRIKHKYRLLASSSSSPPSHRDPHAPQAGHSHIPNRHPLLTPFPYRLPLPCSLRHIPLQGLASVPFLRPPPPNPRFPTTPRTYQGSMAGSRSRRWKGHRVGSKCLFV